MDDDIARLTRLKIRACIMIVGRNSKDFAPSKALERHKTRDNAKIRRSGAEQHTSDAPRRLMFAWGMLSGMYSV